MSVTDEVVELWLMGLDALAEPLALLEDRDPLCPSGELDRLDDERRVARMALRRLLARTFGRHAARQHFVAGAHGKPALPGLPGDFNVSHTAVEPAVVLAPLAGNRTLALIGLGRVAAIGVDLEPERTVRIDRRRRTMIHEAAILVAGGQALPEFDEARTLQAWARLEAWGKANGRGIGRTLTHFGIRGQGQERSGSLDLPQTVEGLCVHDLPLGPRLFAAVAMPRGVALPIVRVLPSDPAALDAALGGSTPVSNSGVDLAPGAGQKGRFGA